MQPLKDLKKAEHGLNNRNPDKAILLSECGVLAYTSENTFEHHYQEINSKIEKLSKTTKKDKYGLTWQSSEFLQKIYFNEIAKLTSEHTRIDNTTKITLHHFWVKV